MARPRGRGRKLLVAAALLGALIAALSLGGPLGLPVRTPHADACAFLRTPFAYEAEQARATYLAAIDAASVDALLPGDPYFGLPPVEVGARELRAGGARRVPATLLKAIAWEESTMTMASRATRFDSRGPALVSFDCGHGLMQVTTGMTVPLGDGGEPTLRQASVATHYGYNIARGAAILADKWNQAPETRPIAGSDTLSDPSVIENWYFAVWSYNGFTAPGSRSSNHPLDPSIGPWPRPRYRCDGTQSRNRYPYQELIWGCMAVPPERLGAKLWNSLPATLPDLTQPRFFGPLSVANFVAPYSALDIPTPRPVHVDRIPAVPADFSRRLFGAPTLEVAEASVLIRLNGLPQDQRASVGVTNAGTGVLSWIASSPDKWMVIDPPAGVALGTDVTCVLPECLRAGELTIAVNPTLLPKADPIGTLRIVPATSSGPVRVIRVEVEADFEVAAPGTSRAY